VDTYCTPYEELGGFFLELLLLFYAYFLGTGRGFSFYEASH